ncbi:hypothetical protein D3C73_1432410 [compost metagenome]
MNPAVIIRGKIIAVRPAERAEPDLDIMPAGTVLHRIHKGNLTRSRLVYRSPPRIPERRNIIVHPSIAVIIA